MAERSCPAGPHALKPSYIFNVNVINHSKYNDVWLFHIQLCSKYNKKFYYGYVRKNFHITRFLFVLLLIGNVSDDN